MEKITIYEFMSSHIEQLREADKLQTANSYTSALGRFMAFTKGVDIPLSDIDIETINSFRDYLISLDVSDNTIAYYLSALRSAYNKAVKRGLIKNDYPFEEISTRVAVPKYVALTEEQLYDLTELDLSGKPELAFARDMFMLSFYLRGMSYYDMAQLRISNVVGEAIEYNDKDGELVTVELEPVIEEIIERHRGKTIGTDYLLPICSGKENFSSAVRILNIRLKKIATKAKIPVSLTSATARHTWATIALKKGLSKRLISRCLGYKNEYFSQKYLENLENLIISKVNKMVIGGIRHR